MGLKEDILSWGDEALLWVDDEAVEAFQKLAITIVDYSPTTFLDAQYAKGVFVNSWYPAVNEFDPTVGGAPDMSGSGSRQRISAIKNTRPFYKQDAFISLSNNLDYAFRVEWAGWPAGEGGKWNWTGMVGPYAPVRNAITYVMGENKQ